MNIRGVVSDKITTKIIKVEMGGDNYEKLAVRIIEATIKDSGKSANQIIKEALQHYYMGRFIGFKPIHDMAPLKMSESVKEYYIGLSSDVEADNDISEVLAMESIDGIDTISKVIAEAIVGTYIYEEQLYKSIDDYRDDKAI